MSARRYLDRLKKPHLAGRCCTGCGYFHTSGHAEGCKSGFAFSYPKDGNGHWYVIVDRATGKEVARNWGPGTRAAAERAARQVAIALSTPKQEAA